MKVSEMSVEDLKALMIEVKYSQSTGGDINTPLGLKSRLQEDAPIVPPLPPEPELPQRLPNGKWRYVTYTSLSTMTPEELALYTDLSPAQVRIWSRDKAVCEVRYYEPRYLFRSGL
jgi:hypothetical protein